MPGLANSLFRCPDTLRGEIKPGPTLTRWTRRFSSLASNAGTAARNISKVNYFSFYCQHVRTNEVRVAPLLMSETIECSAVLFGGWR